MPAEDGATRRGLINRRDLIAALDEAVKRRVTVISAPAGSGKTSLLRDWADRRHHDRRIVFVSVKPGQHDAQLFWLSLLGAIRGTESPPPAPGFDGQAMVDKVLSELTAYGGPVVLIIDDLHELTSAEAAEQLAAVLTNLPTAVHAVVATRRDLPLRLHQLRLAGELAEIRATELRFTVDETRKLLTTAGITLPDQAVTTLYQRTEGWAAGLRLAVLSLAGHPQPERFVAEFSGSDRTVAEYLMTEMLDRQPPEVLRLLLRTSLLDRVNGELADLLTGATGSERILLDLEDANAFVVSLDPVRTWFRYHHLFSGLLRLELRRTLPGDVPDLHRIAARWFADHAGTADAIRHFQAAGDWTEAARLLTDHALSLTLDGQAGTVAALLHTFPARAGDDSPGLALVHAIADLDQLHLDQADAHLDVVRAYAATTSSDRQHRLRTAIASLDLLSARLRGHFDSVFEQVDALSQPAAQSTADVALSNDLQAIALLSLGVTEAWSMRLPESEKHLQEGAALARDIDRPYLEVACRAHLGFAISHHSFSLARQQCEDAITAATRHGWEGDAVIAPAYATLAWMLSWTGEFDRAGEWLERANRATQAGGEPGIRYLIHLIAAILPAARGRHREALTELTAAGQVRMAGRHGWTSRVAGWTIATQARLRDPDRALAALAAVDDELATTHEIGTATAVIHLAEGDPAAARSALKPLLDDKVPTITLIEAYLLEALACKDLGDDRAARAAVERALHLAEPEGLILPFAMTGAWELLTSWPLHSTSHAALVADILDAVRGHTNATASEPLDALSPSELRVLRFLPTNLTRPEIAAELSVSLNTVNTHIRRIYTKLGATDRSSAVQRGRDLRLLSAGRA
ncbi:LuxR C-terminal-related transcriptional regulator [Kribbella sp. NPDC050281]|uniref:LuxR C-terminal-related transcriptional regulator n=1 Tax=Kribbella sp. NPDC050281 TaxID=3155515 RepID=UPI0033C0DC2D